MHYVHYVYNRLETAYAQRGLDINVLDRLDDGYCRRPTTNLLQGSTVWLQTFDEMFGAIRDYYSDVNENTVYFKSWIQRHPYTFVPSWHVHGDADAHGIVSITEQPTATIYKDFEIKNKPGQMHIGPNILHSVKNLSLYAELRVVIAFTMVFDITRIADDIDNYFPIRLRED